MNAKHIFGWLALLGLLMMACHDDNEIFFENVIGEETKDALHMRFRDQPYPKEGNTIYLNPPPLLVPEETRSNNGFLEFELSQDVNFQAEETFRSEQLTYNFCNVHRQLSNGNWHWHFRAVDATGKKGPWSETYTFEIIGDEEVFVTPEFSVLKQNIPAPGLPRVVCFLEKDLMNLQPITSAHPAYKDLIGKADNNTGLKYIFSNANPYGLDITNVYTAYRTIQDPKYDNKLREYAHEIGGYVPTEAQMKSIYSDAFTAANVMNIYTTLYETYNKELSEAEKSNMETVMLNTVIRYHENWTGALESKMFDNHSWQVGIQGITQAAFMICDKYPKAMDALEYLYELWTARAPATGFNHDGSWINGNNYFSVNFITLYYMPMLFSHLTNTDFLKHPWYQNVGKSMIYSWIPGSESTSFGDGVGKYGLAVYNQAGFADFLAREIHDPYAAWYVKECELASAQNPAVLNYKARERSFRLYRIAKEHIPYSARDLENTELENFLWNQDAGYGTAYSNMTERSSNMSLAFRSSPFGSGSHTLADQNSFKLLYKGHYVYTNVGRYGDPDLFAGPHSILQYRHTRGHNTIMINNIGQPFTTKAYGQITRGLNGDHLAYFLGDASHAYCGISDYWDQNIRNVGLAQIPAYGFGETPLNTYKRHIFMLRPNKVVIYDELRADEPATWQWLLHSPTRFHIAGNKLTTSYRYSNDEFRSVAQIFSKDTPDITQTDKWFPGGEPLEEINPRPWNLTAAFGLNQSVKVLTIIQIVDDVNQEEDIWQVGNRFVLGDWKIKAELDGETPAAISITNEQTGTVFSYGYDTVFGETNYPRSQEGSSVLIDTKFGSSQVQEISDAPAPVTRAAK